MKKQDYLKLAAAMEQIFNNGCLVYTATYKIIEQGTFIDALCTILKDENLKFDEVKFRELLK